MKKIYKKAIAMLSAALMLLSTGTQVGAADKVSVTRIELNYTEATIKAGESVELVETIYPEDATRMDVEWETSDAEIAEVDGYGVVDGISPGTATITCKAMDDSGVTATCEVTVTEASKDYVTRIDLNYPNLVLITGEEKQLTATAYPEEALNKAVKWKSGNKNVATIDDDGVVIAVAPGNALITCTAADGKGAKAFCYVTVVNEESVINVTGVEVNPKTLSMQVGDVEGVTATVLPENATNKVVEWSSSDETVATVSNDGTIIAVGVGTADIIATSMEDGEIKDSCTVTVSKTLVAKIKLSKETAVMYIGDKDQITYELIPSNVQNKEVEWSTSNADVVKVDQEGNVEALALGKAVITCTSKDEGGAEASCEITVIEDEIPWPFKDVEEVEGNWKYESVKYVYERGLMTGIKADEFGPQESITRGMVATILYRMAGSPSVTYNNEFSDVAATKYYAKPIAWACKNKIATGYDGGLFKPEKAITRAELAKMLCQYAKIAGYDTSGTVDISTYADASKVPTYAVKYMQWAVANEIISGSKKQNKMYLNPTGNATRAETAAMIMRMLQRFEEL